MRNFLIGPSVIADQHLLTLPYLFYLTTVSLTSSGCCSVDKRLSVSPPHVVGYANGIAQSMVSFSRFLGPIVGGTVRAVFLETSSAH